MDRCATTDLRSGIVSLTLNVEYYNKMPASLVVTRIKAPVPIPDDLVSSIAVCVL